METGKCQQQVVLFSPSMMCADIFDMPTQLQAFEKHCQMLHIDVMDGHFAPNLALSIDYVRALKKKTTLPMDVHLMVDDPSLYLPKLLEIRPEYITVHAETIQKCAFRMLRTIKDAGIKVGVALCPATPVSDVFAYLDMVDLVLVMTVDVGFAGQSFIPQMFDKVAQFQKIRKEKGYEYLIQVDGCIGKPVFKRLYDSGANVYVMGTAGLFNRAGLTMEEACSQMKETFYQEVEGVVENESCTGQ